MQTQCLLNLSDRAIVDKARLIGGNGVLNDATYRDNARRIQKAIVKTNGLSLAADLVEQSFGVATMAAAV